MPKYDTPRDRETIEWIKEVYFLDGISFYEPDTPYFNPVTLKFSMISTKIEPETIHGLVPVYDLFDIPDDHPLEMMLKWEDAIEQWGKASLSPDRFIAALSKLKSFDDELLGSINKFIRSETVDWNRRFSAFLKGSFDDILTGYEEGTLRMFVGHSKEVHQAELDRFYRHSVTV